MTLRVERLDVDHLNNVLADRTRGLSRVSSMQVAQVNSAVTVTHDLGVVPDDLISSPLSAALQTEIPIDVGGSIVTISVDAPVYVFVTDAMRLTWTDKVATIGVVGSPSRIWFFKRIA